MSFFPTSLSPISSPTIMEFPDAQDTESPATDLTNGHPKAPAADYTHKMFYPFHRHHHQISDSAVSASTDSSPTTTVSTVDDSSATEPSPGSSPESPPPSNFDNGINRLLDESKGPFFELQKQPLPRKGRNLKNLAVNTSRHTPRAQSTTSLPLQTSMAADMILPSLASPGFVKPPSPPKRKPSNLGLSLVTPANANKAPPQEIRLTIPAAPAFGRPGTLRHFQSSPSLPLIPGLASQTGVANTIRAPAALETIFSPTMPMKSLQIQEEDDQNFDVPLSREEKPEAYPDGPITVYAPFVDLYLEPTAEQCRRYDVVMNVASEVRNPLVEHTDAAPEEPDIRIDGGGGIQFAPKRPALNVRIAEQHGSAQAEPSPTTPKATPLNSNFPPAVLSKAPTRDPEYIHIKWEHNSDIVPDLLRLCKLIDQKVQQEKRVLVHCQCGVSRSASLVVAYGLYKDPTMSVQEAYDAVKARSKWIGPNMNLIMQLQEFRTSLTRGGILSGNRGLTPITPASAYSEWRGPFSANPSDPTQMMPLTAGPANISQTVEKEVAPAISPGPSSAPMQMNGDSIPPLPTRRTRAVSAIKRTSAYVDPSGHLVPVLQVAQSPDTTAHVMVEPVHDESQSTTPTEPLSSPRSAEFAMTPLRPARAVESDDAFGILSPTSSKFSPSFFDRPALLASLGMGSVALSDVFPRRSTSLRAAKPQPTSTPPSSRADAAPPSTFPRTPTSLSPQPFDTRSRLRGKISSPSLREQRQMQTLQTQISASLPPLSPGSKKRSAMTFAEVDEALMSPRATEFTKNPFALPALAIPEQTLSPAADTISRVEGEGKKEHESEELPRRSADLDPRSPVQEVGGSPIVRNILDVL